ncbi:MAG: ATP-binding protein [Nitrospirota bacterium]|nr:ATP-binding protein [Nitrospirota bacterium]
MTISRYLRLTLAVSIGIAFAVGLVGLWLRDRIHQEAYANLQREMQVLLHLDDVENGVAAAVNAQQSFFLSFPVAGWSEYSRNRMDQAFEKIHRARQALDAIAALEHQEGGLPPVLHRRIDSGLALFEVHLKRMVRLTQLKGYSSPGREGGVAGRVGRMEEVADELDVYLDKLELSSTDAGDMRRRSAIHQVTAGFLVVRRWEKDYFLRDDWQMLSRARLAVAELEAVLSGLPFSASERRQILNRLDRFMEQFQAVALIDAQIADERSNMAETVSSLHRIVGLFVQEEQRSLELSERRMERARDTSSLILLGLFLMVVGVSVVLAFLLTRRITGSLDILTGAAHELGERGDCPIISLEKDDEFGRLADAFNSMVVQLRDAHVQLVQSEKLTATGKLSASIAHEINNPLFGIQGCLQRIQKRLPEDDPDRRLVELALRESHRIARLVQGLRDYHRPHDQTMTEVSLLDTLDDVFLLNEKYLQHAGVELMRNLPHDLPLVHGTRDQLQMVFVNLVTNAVEAMPGGGRLTVDAHQEKGVVVVRFTDTGSGIRDADLPRIFEPFFSTKPEVKGVGLGLSITYGIVRRHSGKIHATSGKDGVGTCFTVILPVRPHMPDTP